MCGAVPMRVRWCRHKHTHSNTDTEHRHIGIHTQVPRRCSVNGANAHLQNGARVVQGGGSGASGVMYPVAKWSTTTGYTSKPQKGRLWCCRSTDNKPSHLGERAPEATPGKWALSMCCGSLHFPLCLVAVNLSRGSGKHAQ